MFGEKGRSQLQRDMRNSIVATVADTNKVKITFPQVRGRGWAGWAEAACSSGVWDFLSSGRLRYSGASCARLRVQGHGTGE